MEKTKTWREECRIARATTQAFLMKKESFTYSELQQEILKQGGILRVSLCVTIADHLKDLEGDGMVKHIIGTDKFEVIK